MLPRLKGKGSELSRLAGGIGTRGPGESKLEIDRRRIEKKIYRLKQKLKDIKRNRNIQRKSRSDPVISLIGYTNAGKSTLMNLITGLNTTVANKLFATLNSKLSSIQLDNGINAIISDTVGFIEKLPHQLVASFRASLEEIKESDILIHVIDCNHSHIENRIKVVKNVLKEIDVLDKELITVFNKTDLISEKRLKELNIYYPQAINISAKTGKGKNLLTKKIVDVLKKNMRKIKIKLPYDKASLVNKIYSNGQVLKEEYKNNCIFMVAEVNKEFAQRIESYNLN